MDAIHHEFDVAEDEEQVAIMMLPPPPPPPHVKLLDRRCMDCVMKYLDADSTDSMAQSCRFFRDACAAADLTPLIETQQHHHRSDATCARPSIDALDDLSVQPDSTREELVSVVQDGGVPSPSDAPLDELSHTDSSQDRLNMQNEGGIQVFISQNTAPSFNERDENNSVALPPCGELSSNSRPFDYLRGDERGPFHIKRTSGVVDLKTDSISVGTPASTSDSSNVMRLQFSDVVAGAEELPAVVSESAGNATFHTFDSTIKQGDMESLELRAFNPLLPIHSMKSIHTPIRERRAWASDRAYTPSTQNSSNPDSETANYVEEIRPYYSDIDQSIDHDSDGVRSDDGDQGEYDHLERTTSSGGLFGSFSISDFFGDIFGSATAVSKRRNNDVDDRGLIKLGEKLYTHNEALKMWKRAKATLAETYDEVDKSGNEKLDATTFFEKSIMYKEKTAKMEEKLACLGQKNTRNKERTKQPSKKQGGDGMNAAQEKRLKKIMITTLSLQEDEAVINSIEQNCTQSEAVNEEFDDSGNRSNDSSLSNNDQSDRSTSSFGSGDYNPSFTARLPRTRLVTPRTEDASVATPLSSMIDSVLGSNYGVEVTSTCCKFVSENAPPQLIDDAGGYKEATKPERVVSTRKPRTLAQHGLGISSSKRRNNKMVKEDKKKSSRSLRLTFKKASK